MCLHLEPEEQWQASDSRVLCGEASCKELEGHPSMLLGSSQFSVTDRYDLVEGPAECSVGLSACVPVLGLGQALTVRKG